MHLVNRVRNCSRTIQPAHGMNVRKCRNVILIGLYEIWSHSRWIVLVAWRDWFDIMQSAHPSNIQFNWRQLYESSGYFKSRHIIQSGKISRFKLPFLSFIKTFSKAHIIVIGSLWTNQLRSSIAIFLCKCNRIHKSTIESMPELNMNYVLENVMCINRVFKYIEIR